MGVERELMEAETVGLPADGGGDAAPYVLGEGKRCGRESPSLTFFHYRGCAGSRILEEECCPQPRA